ncbi:MAG: hypothetical protein ACTMH5_07685 [Brachybacterium sp.]|uniref:hypothetical protein n=1 Tax=Brachybacterium sp. TaxID=1891286 RepID=UPI003F8F7C39
MIPNSNPRMAAVIEWTSSTGRTFHDHLPVVAWDEQGRALVQFHGASLRPVSDLPYRLVRMAGVVSRRQEVEG